MYNVTVKTLSRKFAFVKKMGVSLGTYFALGRHNMILNSSLQPGKKYFSPIKIFYCNTDK